MTTAATLFAISAFTGLAILLGLVIDDVIWGIRDRRARSDRIAS